MVKLLVARTLMYVVVLAMLIAILTGAYWIWDTYLVCLAWDLQALATRLIASADDCGLAPRALKTILVVALGLSFPLTCAWVQALARRS